MEAFCVKCKQKREISNPQEIEMKRKGGKTGRAMTGVCPVCGTKMFRILPSKKEVTGEQTINDTNSLGGI
jgi:hypothetical protein